MNDRIFVIDASIGIKWYINEDYSDLALEILKKFEEPRIKLYAPLSFKSEFTNAIRKYLVRGIIDKKLAEEIMAEIERIPIRYEPSTRKRIKRAFDYSILKSITVYDAVYIVLAKELGGKFITADKKLYSSVSDDPSIVFIADIKKDL